MNDDFLNGKKSLNWGLIGCGDIVQKRVGPALRDLDNCNLVAVARANSSKAEECAKRFDAARWYGNWKELIGDNDVEAVYIATPPYLHESQTVSAAEMGKHIVCEKPMSLSVDSCKRMIDAAKANGVSLSIAYYRHFYPIIRRVKEILNEGIIGKPVVVDLKAFEYFDIKRGDSRDWLVELDKAGGGPLMDFGCHRIEVLINLFGSDNVESVKGVNRNIIFNREVEDTSVGIVSFSGSVTAMLTVTTGVYESMDSLDIFGSRGSIRIPKLNGDLLVLRVGGKEIVENHPAHPNLHQPYIEAVTEAILNGSPIPVDGEYAMEVNRVIEGIYSD